MEDEWGLCQVPRMQLPDIGGILLSTSSERVREWKSCANLLCEGNLWKGAALVRNSIAADLDAQLTLFQHLWKLVPGSRGLTTLCNTLFQIVCSSACSLWLLTTGNFMARALVVKAGMLVRGSVYMMLLGEVTGACHECFIFCGRQGSSAEQTRFRELLRGRLCRSIWAIFLALGASPSLSAAHLITCVVHALVDQSLALAVAKSGHARGALRCALAAVTSSLRKWSGTTEIHPWSSVKMACKETPTEDNWTEVQLQAEAAEKE